MELLPFASAVVVLAPAVFVKYGSFVSVLCCLVLAARCFGLGDGQRNRKSNVRKLLPLFLPFDCPIVCCDRTSGDGVDAIRVGHCFDDDFDVIGVGST